MGKELQYMTKILSQLAPMFEDRLCENFIGMDELSKADNATIFLHALANLVPCAIYQEITHDEVDMLKFNHIANTLCFQFSKQKVEENG